MMENNGLVSYYIIATPFNESIFTVKSLDYTYLYYVCLTLNAHVF